MIQVVPLTTTIRPFGSEMVLPTGLEHESAAQCQHIRAVSPARVHEVRGNVGSMALAQIRGALAVVIDLPP